MIHRFAEGDRVQLVKPFRWNGDEEDYDQQLDEKLRANGEPVVGKIVEILSDGYRVDWPNLRPLMTDEDVIDLYPPLTDDEVQEAIASILASQPTDDKAE